MDAIQKYLARYAEAQTPSYTSEKAYHAALVVPAYDEPYAAMMDLAERACTDNVLAILVINVPSNAPKDARARTFELFTQLVKANLSNVLLVNCIEEELPKRKGVGLARKIGCDIALSLQFQGQIASPWIYTTDADAYLPDNYFNFALDLSDDGTMNQSGARVFAHRHVAPDKTLQAAVDMYDLHMAYYIAGLTYAGSRYAHPSLGSTIAIHGETYAQVRGFPKKNAAEDFYLLNKVAKIAPVHFVPDVQLTLQGRLSERVPFGTGPALAKITKQDSTLQSYNFESFAALKVTLDALDTFSDSGKLSVPSHVSNILQQLGWSEREQLFADRYEPIQRKKAVHDWFDALKTLKFMHKAAEFYPDQDLHEAVSSAPHDVLKTIDRHFQRDGIHN